MAEGVDGLLQDKTRPSGIAPLDAAVADKVVELTLAPPSHEATHWAACFTQLILQDCWTG